MKLNWNLVLVLAIVLAIVVGIFLIIRGRPDPVVLPGEPYPVVEWKEKIVPVTKIKWKDKLVPVPYPVYEPGRIDTLWLTNSGYAVFDSTLVVSTEFVEKELQGLYRLK